MIKMLAMDLVEGMFGFKMRVLFSTTGTHNRYVSVGFPRVGTDIKCTIGTLRVLANRLEEEAQTLESK